MYLQQLWYIIQAMLALENYIRRKQISFKDLTMYCRQIAFRNAVEMKHLTINLLQNIRRKHFLLTESFHNVVYREERYTIKVRYFFDLCFHTSCADGMLRSYGWCRNPYINYGWTCFNFSIWNAYEVSHERNRL